MTYANYPKAARQTKTNPAPPAWVQLDPSFESEKIYKLTVLNFKRYVSDKEKALVMFYDSRKGSNPREESLFSDVANASFRDEFGFAAVDCATDFPVCVRYSGCDTPMFKLYSNGYEVSAIKDPSKISMEQIRMLMKMTPILNSPRGEIGRNVSITPPLSREPENRSSTGKKAGFFSRLKRKF